MKYDDATWHSGGNFPKDLPTSAGGTHIGMFAAWCMLEGMAGAVHLEDFPEELERLRSRSITPGRWFVTACDGKFIDEDLNEEGNAFAQFYYDSKFARYLEDYTSTLAHSGVSLYHVLDSWENFDILAPVIAKRYGQWKNGQT